MTVDIEKGRSSFFFRLEGVAKTHLNCFVGGGVKTLILGVIGHKFYPWFIKLYEHCPTDRKSYNNKVAALLN